MNHSVKETDILIIGAGFSGLATGTNLLREGIEDFRIIDRGHAEMPIKPDFVGKNIPTSKSEVIKVSVEEFDGECGVSIYTL